MPKQGIFMKKQIHVQDQVFWYLQRGKIVPCTQDMHADVVIVGGGMAGLAAAQAWHARGKKVVLLEQYYCGSGASGKSSGFITQNAELSLTDFSHKYGPQGGMTIWKAFSAGVQDIKNNIFNNNFSCGYEEQDTLIIADSAKAMAGLKIEHDTLQKMGYPTRFYDQKTIKSQVKSDGYFGGIVYENTFGIDGYRYCQELKNHLQSQGVLIFEETPVIEINDHAITTPHAQITADYIVVCTDRFTPELGLLTQEVSHVQTFLMMSQVLSDEQVAMIFPDKKLMVWDTQTIYNYFRIDSNNRMLVGGSDFSSTYSDKARHDYDPIIQKLTGYIAQKFPELTINFEQTWPGLIGISKDISPIAGVDKDKPYLFYVAACAGLPIAAALGRYSAEHLVDGSNELADYFSPYRKFPISGIAQSILGDKLSFMLSHIIKKNIP